MKDINLKNNKAMHSTYKYIMALVFSLCLMTSCKDEENINSSDATVSMGEMTYSVKESKGLFTIPVVVTGEQNGDIKVRVEVKSETANCKVDENFIVTATDVVIPSNKKSVNIEIKAIDDRIINDDRQFSVTITNVVGAKINTANNKTLVTLIDNDDIPYDRMDGEWEVTATNLLTEASEKVTWTTRLTTVVDDSEDGYGSLITMSPWRMWNGETYAGSINIKHTLMFSYNASSQTATLTLKLGETMCEGVILGDKEDELDLTNCFMRSAAPTQTSYTLNGSVIGTVNSDLNKIKFNLPIMGLLYDANSVPFSYWFYYSDIEMTKK